jgi:hypothetical protein
MIFEKQASFNQIITSNLVFPDHPAVAHIYGTATWNGQHDEDSLMRVAASDRIGLLGRARFTFTGRDNSDPIGRGVKVYRKFFCGTLELPPDNSSPEGVEINEDMTDREHLIAITEVEGTSCVGCHQNIINPLGLSFDNFNPLGQLRNQQLFFFKDYNKRNEVRLEKPINSQTVVNIPNIINTSLNNSVDLSHHVANSPLAHACFSHNLWNFAQRQDLPFEDRGCAADSTFTRSQGSVLEILRNIAFEPEFRKRSLK